MIYGYARVSTVKQLKNGSSLEDQKTRLMDAGVLEEHIFQDSYTGTKMDRPNFTRLMNLLQTGDTLIVTKLDRFARTAVEGGQIVQELHSRGVIIHILNMGIADNTPMGKLMVHILLSFAEFERDMIVERTQAGRQTTGNYGGRPKKNTRIQLDHAMHLLDDEHYSYTDVEKMTGISKSTLLREHNKRKNDSV